MANFNFNKVILGGRLTADPELKTTPSGVTVTTFTVAVNRRFGGKDGENPQADFINVTAWRQTAEFITRYFRKASSICLVGVIQTRSWTDQNAQKRFTTEIVAEEAYFVDTKNESPITAQQYAPSPVPAPQVQMPAPGVYNSMPGANFAQMEDDEELPF